MTDKPKPQLTCRCGHHRSQHVAGAVTIPCGRCDCRDFWAEPKR